MVIKFKEIFIKIRYFIILQIVMFLCILTACAFHSLSFLTGLRYSLFQLIGVFCVGYSFLLVINKRQNSFINTISLSYALGLFFIFFEYLITIIFNLSSSFINLLFCFCSVLVIYKHRIREEEFHIKKQNFIFILLLLLLIYLICFFSVSLANSTFNYNTLKTTKHRDLLYWIGNAIALSKSFPPQNIRLSGNYYYYHYFSSIIIAQTYRITGISIQIISLYFSFIIPSFLLVFSSLYLSSSLLFNDNYLYLSVIGILLTEGISVTYSQHMYFLPIGFDYGQAFSMISIGYLIYMISINDKKNISQMISFILILMCTGLKAPVSLVIMVGYGVYCLFLLINKEYAKACFWGLIYISAFIIVFFVFVGGLDNYNSPGGIEIMGIKKGWENNPWAQLFFYNDIWLFGDGALAHLISLVKYVININTGATYGLLIALINVVKNILNKKEIKIELIIVIAISLTGIVLTIFTKQDGNSQMYFAMASIPYCIVAGIYSIINEKKLLYKKTIMHMQLIGIAIGLYIFAFGPKEDVYRDKSFYGQAIRKVKEGYSVWCYKCDDNLQIENGKMYEWLRTNTPVDSVLAIDKSVDSDNLNQELIVFSERLLWNDGTYDRTEEINRRNSELTLLLSSNNIQTGLSRIGINYLLVPTSSQYNRNIARQCDLVYENASYYIYSNQ